MTRSFSLLALLALTLCLGCGRSSDSAPQAAKDRGEAAAAPSGPASATAAADESDQPSASAVVSQFLDRVRRGGEDSGAGELLTTRAQSELKRIGRTVQPIGSPDARFEVTRSEAVPEEENSRLVHTIWSEPSSDGERSELQVVWALQQEQAGWRISGLAMELEPGTAPTVIDFENGDLMAKLLAEPASQTASGDTTAPAASEEASQAAAPSPEATR